MELEHRSIEVRAGDGRTVAGLAVPFGREGTIGGKRERFDIGSARTTGSALLSLGHRTGRLLAREPQTLVFESLSDGLHFTATLPETTDATDALELIRSGIVGHASVEFVALRERHSAGVRVVQSAEIKGLALVANPAYPDARVEAREHAEAVTNGLAWWALA